MANKFKKTVRRIVNAVQRNEAKRETLIQHIDRINRLVFSINSSGILDLEIKIEDSYKQLESIEESEQKKIALFQLKGYEAFIEFHKKLTERVV